MTLSDFCKYKNIPSDQCKAFRIWLSYVDGTRLPLREWEKLWADFLGIELA